MARLIIYYDSHAIGHADEWQREGEVVMIADNTLGLMPGMVLEVRECGTEDKLSGATEQATAGGVIIRLEERLPL